MGVRWGLGGRSVFTNVFSHALTKIHLFHLTVESPDVARSQSGFQVDVHTSTHIGMKSSPPLGIIDCEARNDGDSLVDVVSSFRPLCRC